MAPRSLARGAADLGVADDKGVLGGLAVGAAAGVLGERVRRRGLAAGVLGDDYEESEDMDGWGGGEGGDQDVRSRRQNQEMGAKPRKGRGENRWRR